MAVITNHVEKIKNMHLLVAIKGGRNGNTTAPNRSTATKTRLWMDTNTDTNVKNKFNLHITLAKSSPNSQESFYNSITFHGIRINGINKSEIAMLTVRKLIISLKVCVLKTTVITQELRKIETTMIRL